MNTNIHFDHSVWIRLKFGRVYDRSCMLEIISGRRTSEVRRSRSDSDIQRGLLLSPVFSLSPVPKQAPAQPLAGSIYIPKPSKSKKKSKLFSEVKRKKWKEKAKWSHRLLPQANMRKKKKSKIIRSTRTPLSPISSSSSPLSLSLSSFCLSLKTLTDAVEFWPYLTGPETVGGWLDSSKQDGRSFVFSPHSEPIGILRSPLGSPIVHCQ